MNKSIARRKTYEIVARWIAKALNVNIKMEPNAVPRANPKTKQIILPSNISDEHIDKVLALILHEAAHIRHTTFDLKKLGLNNATDKITHMVMNSIEDARIDMKMMAVLPNISHFYIQMLKYLHPTEEQKKKTPFQLRVLSELITRSYGCNFDQFLDRDRKVRTFIQDKYLESHFNNAIRALDRLEYDSSRTKGAREAITKVRDLIFPGYKPPPPPPPKSQPQPQQGEGECKPNENGKSKGKGEGKDDNKEPNGGNGEAEPNGSDEKLDDIIKQAEQMTGGSGLTKHKELFKCEPGHMASESIAFDASTRTAFKRLLDTVETETVHNGQTLDTDNLLAYYTGDVNMLFKEDVKVRKRKSKIIILLDSSGSMTNELMDRKPRNVVVANMCNSMKEVLDEVRAEEGLNVDYSIRGFDSSYYKLYPEMGDAWYSAYLRKQGGSTWIGMGYRNAQDEILKDNSIDGNKLIIVVTDGYVSSTDCKDIKKEIIKHNTDIKVMFIGIGTPQKFKESITDKDIIAQDLAESVLIEALTEMLD